MNKYLSILVVAWAIWPAAVSVHAEPWEAGTVAQIHFAGGAAVAADPNSAGLKYLWASPDALALRAQTLDKLSRSLEAWLRTQITPNLVGPVSLRPLLDDLVNSEWQLDLSQPGGGVKLVLSIRLDNARAQVWQGTLQPVVDAWKRTSSAHAGRLVRSNNWLVLQLGNTPAPATADAVSGLKGAWLTAYMDWARLAAWFPGVDKFDVPKTFLQVAGRNGNFEVAGNLFLSQPLGPLGNWQFPANNIHSPIIGLTAVRGISGWLRQQPWAASIGLAPLPDQVFFWVDPGMQFQTYVAVPMSSASAALPKFAQFLEPHLHDGTFSPMLSSRLAIAATNNQISITGLPFIGAYLEARRDVAGEILLAGMVPNVPRGRPLPPDLLAPLNEPGLVYYGWEATAERMKLFPQLYQLMFVFSGHRQLDANSVAGKWLAQIAPTLGQCVTTATERSPTELSFTRKAPAGLTAIELVALASWLEAPNFPGCNLRMPPPPRRPHPPRNISTGTPLPFSLHH